MAQKHTPGPWEIDADGFQIFGTSQSAGLVNIADLHDQDTEKEALANARLIAAAPDLLEAAKQALTALSYLPCDHEGRDPEACRECAVFALVENAIAKAQG